MKISHQRKVTGFTLGEVMIALSLSSVILAASITSSVALQRSFNAIDKYFATHMQQIRIIDYMNRDVKRGLVVTTSVDLQTVTVTLPNYLIQQGDPEAVANPALVGTPRTPTITITPGGQQVNYGWTTSSVAYSISGMSILRTEDGLVTTIAASTDQLVQKTTDVELANTEYAKTSVTFTPMFACAGSVANGTGTSIYSTSYLRNRRRG